MGKTAFEIHKQFVEKYAESVATMDIRKKLGIP